MQSVCAKEKTNMETSCRLNDNMSNFYMKQKMMRILGPFIVLYQKFSLEWYVNPNGLTKMFFLLFCSGPFQCKSPHFRVFLKENLPKRLHYSDNRYL